MDVNMEEDFKLKDEMVENGVMLNVVTYSTIVHGLCNTGQMEDTTGFFNEMLNKGLSPNVVSYTIIHGYCKCDMMKDAQIMLKEMED